MLLHSYAEIYKRKLGKQSKYVKRGVQSLVFEKHFVFLWHIARQQ